MIVEIKFSHRRNLDGTWQSICPECYKTVAENREERDLKQPEGTMFASHSIGADSDRLAYSLGRSSTEVAVKVLVTIMPSCLRPK